MAIQDSGQIKISDIVAEFGGTAPHGMTEYYRNGDNVPGNNTNVPESGQISLTNFYSAVNEIQQTYSSTTTNLNLATVFGGNWGTAVPKRVTVNSGVTIGATSGNAAILIPSGMGGTLVIDNSGSIEGHGGAANSGAGGNAITATHTSGVTINNASGAAIKAGGGGGGQGGTGGTGGNGGSGGTGGGGEYDYVTYTQPCNDYAPKGDSSFALNHQIPNICLYQRGGDGRYQNAYACMTQYYLPSWVFQCLNKANTNGGAGGAGGSSGGAGGAGGAGGVGQGYNQTNTSGASGSAGASGGAGSSGSSGGTNAGAGGTGGARGQGGTGGTGGAGGTFGNTGGTGLTGSTGNTGATGNSGANGNRTNGSGGSGGSSGSSGSSGSAGGAAGFYITNRGSITFNNSGSVAGQ